MLITGAGAGIGKVIASLFYEKGANLVLVYLDTDIARIGAEMGFVAARCASEAAIINMTKVFALEWGPHNVQTNALSPTVVLTELGRKYWVGERGEEMKKKILTRRFVYPEEIAACTLFLASDAAGMINGENLIVDGCYTVQ